MAPKNGVQVWDWACPSWTRGIIVRNWTSVLNGFDKRQKGLSGRIRSASMSAWRSMSVGLPSGRWSSSLKDKKIDYNTFTLRRSLLYILICVCVCFSCNEQKEHTAAAIHDRDSASVMTSYGVNTLISDSGVIKYRIVTEEWDVNQIKKPSRWTFSKGLFLEQFDENFHVQSYIQCDTAYYYDQLKLWELRSRVRILTKDGLRFSSEQLFWDESAHELYSHVFSRLVTPERTLQGSYFRSDERMTKYFVSNTKGVFERTDLAGGNESGESDSAKIALDSIQKAQRQQTQPQRKNISIPLTH